MQHVRGPLNSSDSGRAKTDSHIVNAIQSPRLLLISQVYVPDPMAVGQHCADLAEEMAHRGWHVTVYTSSRGYDDPSVRFPRTEHRNGVFIRRLPLSSFGKGSIPVRLLGQALFMTQAIIRAMFLGRLAAVVVSTSPPFAGFGGALLSLARGVPFVWWVMDLNPDQMIAAGKVASRSIFVRVFDWMNRMTLRRAGYVITLDRFMAERLRRKAEPGAKLIISPPWPHTDPQLPDSAGHQELPDAGAAFRKKYGLEDSFVVMYSGNHALQHPLDTLLEAAGRLEGDQSLKFVFVGGGAGKASVEQRIAKGATNIISLPYQPLQHLKDSLGAADLHVVSMGPEVVGIVHPCKIYGAMAVGKPILFFGPALSHAGEIIECHDIGWRVEHGDVPAAVAAIRAAVSMPKASRTKMGLRGASIIIAAFSKTQLRKVVCDTVERLRCH